MATSSHPRRLDSYDGYRRTIRNIATLREALLRIEAETYVERTSASTRIHNIRTTAQDALAKVR